METDGAALYRHFHTTITVTVGHTFVANIKSKGKRVFHQKEHDHILYHNRPLSVENLLVDIFLMLSSFQACHTTSCHAMNKTEISYKNKYKDKAFLILYNYN